MSEGRTFEDVAIAHKAAWDCCDFDTATILFREAREIVGEKGTVKQMGDGALQIVPNGG
jgi:hypothetical protein